VEDRRHPATGGRLESGFLPRSVGPRDERARGDIAGACGRPRRVHQPAPRGSLHRWVASDEIDPLAARRGHDAALHRKDPVDLTFPSHGKYAPDQCEQESD